MNRLFLALPLAAALSACGSADEPPTDLETARSDGEAQALARNIEAGDFLDLALAYALINVVGILAVLEFFQDRFRKQERVDSD